MKNKSLNAVLNISIILLFLSCYFLAVPLLAEDKDNTVELSKEMLSAYSAYEELQPFIASKKRFLAPESNSKISELIAKLAKSFHKAEKKDSSMHDNPGFVRTLQTVNEQLEDIQTRFNQGRKEYALWQIRQVNNYCISCHTTYSVAINFSDKPEHLSTLTPVEKADFYFATRQFDKASSLLFSLIKSQDNSYAKMGALRKWLTLHIRVKKDPQATALHLKEIMDSEKFSSFDLAELKEYENSLLRWSKEPEAQQATLSRAESLIRKGLTGSDLLVGSMGAVDLLRATAMLHELLEQEPEVQQPDRPRILYLLGLSYSRLPLFYPDEMPMYFLDQCVRENPATNVARDCYRLYANKVQLDYTGSGGAHIPEEVDSYLQGLYSLAYGKK